MQRTTAVSVGLLFVLGAVLLFVLSRGSSRPAAKPARAATPAAVSAAPSALPSAAASASAAAVDELAPGAGSEGFETLPDGRRVPELPATAPKSVGFGVVLITYEGAQSAPKDARSKADAKLKAISLLAEAKQDFAAAVSRGDRGSRADAGHVPRGVLEPAVEYPIFLLEKGAIHPEPIDTPRGYWIVRRNQ